MSGNSLLSPAALQRFLDALGGNALFPDPTGLAVVGNLSAFGGQTVDLEAAGSAAGILIDGGGVHFGGLSALANSPSPTTPAIFIVSGDPSSGSGVAAPQGSVALDTAGIVFVKTGSGDTDWTALATVP